MEYPKIETLYDRDERTHAVIPSQLRLPEFALVNQWHLTEKMDGTNIRIMWLRDEQFNRRLVFGGRTDSAQIPSTLINYLNSTFTPELMSQVFETAGENDVILFGEGYGEKIQKGGGAYRKGVSFRLFDVLVGRWWLEQDALVDIANKLNILTVPLVSVVDYLPRSLDDLERLIVDSFVATQDGGTGCRAEGIVARTVPILFNRYGNRLMWKLKYRDFK